MGHSCENEDESEDEEDENGDENKEEENMIHLEVKKMTELKMKR